jgi:hypothetical protein
MSAAIYSLKWRTVMGRPIHVAPVARRELSIDWDSERLRCWSRPKLPQLSSLQGELLVAKAMCTLFAAGIVAITTALKVLA